MIREESPDSQESVCTLVENEYRFFSVLLRSRGQTVNNNTFTIYKIPKFAKDVCAKMLLGNLGLL